jgi:Animal haem peroxidase
MNTVNMVRFLAIWIAIVAVPLIFPSFVAAQVNSENTKRQRSDDDEDRNSNTFTRLFKLKSFAEPTEASKAALLEVGKKGGILDARDNLASGPVQLIVDLSLSADNRNNPLHTAGTTFLGQFLDHDMTLDRSSPLGVPTDPKKVLNGRTPAFDLDSVYGEGPLESHAIYDPVDWIKFRVESVGRFEDLPRDPLTNVAILAERRNDENLMLAGLHVAFLLFHNNAVDLIRSCDPSLCDVEVFLMARRMTTHHYQWIIRFEFLPSIVGPELLEELCESGARFYKPRFGKAKIPVEFQITYRFGHSMVRPSYRANFTGDDGSPFFGMIFDPAAEGSFDPIDLRGGARAPRRFIDWQTFFDFGDGNVKPNKRIDTRLSTPLFDLPLGAILPGTPPTSLAQRNLLRHLTWSLPSGQSIAEEIGVPKLKPKELSDIGRIRRSFATSTPLLFYVLREAEVMADGLHLGPVGGSIVGEVFLGLLESDPDSFLNASPSFRPMLPTQTGNPEDFRMIDFLTFAGVAPIDRVLTIEAESNP